MYGNTAAAHVAYAYTDVAAIHPCYPVPSGADSVTSGPVAGQKNIFGNHRSRSSRWSLRLRRPLALCTALCAGAVTTFTFTASQACR